jgi:UDP-N-acetylmuramoyl-tripeptide--D-alanyl-D-alanine ligase
MAGTIAACVFIIGVITFTHRRLLSYLRYFQQEEYNEVRFKGWLDEKKAYDTRGALVALSVAGSAVVWTHPAWTIITSILGTMALYSIAHLIEGDPRTSGKLTLKMTQRASKILYLSAFFSLLTILGITLLGVLASPCCSSICVPSPGLPVAPQGWKSLLVVALGSSLLFRVTPYYLMLANRALSPAEKRLQNFYVDDAKRILREVNPFIIGITGSYGKTGAKAALGELLPQCVGPTFWPKKSINTVMGITRDIRENLRPHHKYGVIEMGAYGIGSIQRLCGLTPPKAAIVTAVGIMHLERFGSEENVFLAKSELAQSVPDDGILVCNGDNPGARRMAEANKKAKTLLYGLDPASGHLDCSATDIVFTPEGTKCVVQWNGEIFHVQTPLLGRPALSNALAAFTMACALGAEPAYAAAALGNLQPVDNRLVLDRKGSVSFIRDAYNSNPTGFSAALEILHTIEGKRKILLTPGMIELGERQYKENEQIAEKAAKVCDLIVVISAVNREALLSGLAKAEYPKEKTVVVDTRAEAFAYLAQHQIPGDLVLIENDLGDLLEGEVKF